MRNIGDRYRPIATVGNIAGDGKPLVLNIPGDRYILDDPQRRKERKAHEAAMFERDLLLKLLSRKLSKLPPRAHELKLEYLRRILIGSDSQNIVSGV